MVVSTSKRLCRLREHRGGYDSPNSRQGTEQFDVTMPAPTVVIGRIQRQLIQNSFNALAHLEICAGSGTNPSSSHSQGSSAAGLRCSICG